MLNDDFGYIQVSKFGRTSHVELLNAIAQLSHQKCKGFIIDLRGNTGGYMEAATRMVNWIPIPLKLPSSSELTASNFCAGI